MLGSNVKTHQDIKTIVNNVLDISSGLSPEDVIQSTQVVERTLKRLHQVAMFEIELDVLAKEQHDNALKKHFLVVANTVNKGIGRENLNARESIQARYGAAVRDFNSVSGGEIQALLTELLLLLDPIDDSKVAGNWWTRFIAKFKSKPVKKETVEDNHNTGLVNG